MWLLGVILDNICGFFKVCFSRTLSKQIYRNCAVLMTGTVVVAVLVFTAGSFTGGGKNQVYAVKASRNAEEAGEGEDVKEEELQAGLMGIVASVNKLEAYSQAADGVDLETANQEILAGTSRIRKMPSTRSTWRSVQKTSEASAIMHSRKCWKIRWMGMIITHFFRS